MPELTERQQVGRHADLSDQLTVVDARSCPLLSMIPKGKEPTDVVMQWPVENYPAPRFDGVLETEDVDTFEDSSEGRAILKNHIQAFRRAPMVGRFAQNIINVAGIGRKQQMAKAIVKMLVAIKRDIECALCSDNDAREEDGSDAYLTRGLGSWISSTAQTVLPVADDYLTPSESITTAAIAAITESVIQGLFESSWNQTGQNKRFIGLVGSKLKMAFTAMTIYQPGVSATVSALRTYSGKLDGKKIVSTVDFLEGDFGSVELHPSAWLANNTSTAAAARRGYLLDMEMLELRWNERPSFRPLQDEGGGPRGVIDAVCGLVVKNPKGLIKLAGTT